MKKIAFLIAAALLVAVAMLPALCEIAEPGEAFEPAEAVEAVEPVEPDADVPTGEPKPGEPMTWAYLATIAGATAATLLLVQYTKAPLDRVWKIPTRLFVYFVALAFLLLGTYFTQGLTLDTAALTAVNALVVAVAAYGAYEVTFAKLDK